MKMKKMLSAFIAAATLSTVASSFSFASAEAPEVVAIAGLRGQAGTYNYWGENDNSGDITVKDANIDGNAQYEVIWDITGDGTGSIEFLIIEIKETEALGTAFTADTYPDLSLTVDEVYIDGILYEFEQNDAAVNLKYYESETKRGTRAYLTDTWNVNNGNTFGLAPDQPITSQVKVVFTIDGLYNEGTSNVTPTEPSISYRTGDVDADGNINALDASMVLTEYAAKATHQPSTLDEVQALAAETNGDGNIDALDASEILSYYSYTATGGDLSFDEWMAL